MTYDLISGSLESRTLALDLAPDAREIDLELGWSAWLFDRAALRLGVAHAFDAGHVAGASDTAGFVTFTIDDSGSVGLYPDIAIDDLDRVHVTYYDETNTDLKYAQGR